MAVVSTGNAFRTAEDLDGLATLGYSSNLVDFALIEGPGTPPGPLTTPAAVRTAGATLVDAVTLAPTLTQNWAVLSASFQLYLAFVAGQTTTIPNPPGIPTWTALGGIAGKLGKILGGMVLGGNASPTQGFDPIFGGPTPGLNFNVPAAPLPQDSSLLTTLFDSAVDDLPPLSLPLPAVSLTVPAQSPPIQNLLAVQGQVTLPVPRAIPPGSSIAIGIGIWMLPSLYALTAGGAINTFGLAGCYGSYAVNYDNGLPSAGQGM